MRSWRNWQTRKTKDLVGNSMQVQFLSTAPKIAESLVGYRYFFVLCTVCKPNIYMQVHARNTANVKPFLFRDYPVFRRSAQRADTCRPHQNRVFMRNERINTRFFCIFDVFMRLKLIFWQEILFLASILASIFYIITLIAFGLRLLTVHYLFCMLTEKAT